MSDNTFETLSQATRSLRKDGYTDRYQMEGDALKNLETDALYGPEDLTIRALYRFEGATNPSDLSILYAVEDSDGRKGTITSGYGIYANEALLAFLDQVDRELPAS